MTHMLSVGHARAQGVGLDGRWGYRGRMHVHKLGVGQGPQEVGRWWGGSGGEGVDVREVVVVREWR